MPQPQVALHVFASQVQITVAKPQFFTGVLVMMKGRRSCLVEHLQLRGLKLHFPGGQIRVDRTLRPRPHAPVHRKHVFAAQPFGFGKGIRIPGIEYHLQQPLPVPQVHEDDAAVIPAPMHPAGDGDFLSDVGAVHLTAVVAAHGIQPSAAST